MPKNTEEQTHLQQQSLSRSFFIVEKTLDSSRKKLSTFLTAKNKLCVSSATHQKLILKIVYMQSFAGKSANAFSRCKQWRENRELEARRHKSVAICLLRALPFHQNRLGPIPKSYLVGEDYAKAQSSLLFSRYETKTGIEPHCKVSPISRRIAKTSSYGKPQYHPASIPRHGLFPSWNYRLHHLDTLYNHRIPPLLRRIISSPI